MARRTYNKGFLQNGFVKYYDDRGRFTRFPAELSTFDDVGGLQWHLNPEFKEWIAKQTAFTYDYLDNGHFTARREKRRNTFYWYAFGDVRGETKKVYIGKQENLRLDILKSVSYEFKQARRATPAPSQPAAKAKRLTKQQRTRYGETLPPAPAAPAAADTASAEA